MVKEKYGQNKYKWIIISTIFVVAVMVVAWFISREKEGLDIPITQEEYRTYDHYGFAYEEDESEVYDWLLDILPLSHFEVSAELDIATYYSNFEPEDHERIKDLLPLAHSIQNIEYLEESDGVDQDHRTYYITYISNKGYRVIIEYHENGLVTKTVGFVNKDKIVSVTNRLTKDVSYANLDKENPMFMTDQWQIVAGKEFVNLDVWAGSGLYFQQVGDKGYCTLMIFGSGVPIAEYYTSELTIDDEGIFHLELPEHMASGGLRERSDHDKLKKVTISVEEGQVILGELSFEPSDGTWNYDALQEMRENVRQKMLED